MDLTDEERAIAAGRDGPGAAMALRIVAEAGRLMGQHEQLFCSLDTDGGPGMGGEGPPGSGPHGIHAYRPTGSPQAGQTFQADDGSSRFNLLGWNGKDPAPNLFPKPGTP